MSILVLESNPAQAETIRHIVCNVLGTELTLVESIDHALHALHSTTPDLVLLPALVSPAEEAKLLTFLRKHPNTAHVETLITPVLGSQEKPAESPSRGWLRWASGRRSPQAPSIDETDLFTERLTWSLHSARERRQFDGELRAALSDADAGRTPNVEAVAPIELEEAVAPEVVAEPPMQSIAEEPVTSSLASQSDRRAQHRFHAHELKALRASRLKSGPWVNVLDVSANGALLESDTPLESDSEAVLELITDLLHTHYVPFRVVRHQVATQGGHPRYVEACAFLTPLDVSDLQGREANTNTQIADADGFDGFAALRSVLEPYLSEPGLAERRRHVRVDGPFDGCRRGLMDVPVLIHNLSEGGCFIDSRLEVEAGHQLTVGLQTIDKEWIDITAEVVHNQPGVGFAVRFVETSDPVRDHLARIVAERTAAVEAPETTTS